MSIVRMDMSSGAVTVERLDGSVEQQIEAKRVEAVVEQLWDIVSAQPADVAVSAVVSVLAGVLVASSQEPLQESQVVVRAVDLLIEENLKAQQARSGAFLIVA